MSYKSIEEITTLILDRMELSEAEKAPGSDLYALVRAVATSQNLNYQELEKIKSASLPGLAKGDDLDNWASVFNLRRKEGSSAAGYCLGLSEENTTFAKNTILTDLESGFQYVVTEETRLNAFLESKIKIRAVKQGRRSNLGAGVELFTTDNPEVQLLIGEYRTTAGKVCGDLKGGLDPESDSSLWARVNNYIINFKTTGLSSLKKILLNEQDVLWVDTQTPLPAYLIVWVETTNDTSQSRLNFLESIVNYNKAAGILSEVRLINKLGLDFSISVQPQSDVDLDTLSENIKTKLYEYLFSLSLGENLVISKLSSLIKEVNGVGRLKIEEPSFDQVVESDKVIRPNTINVKYQFT